MVNLSILADQTGISEEDARILRGLRAGIEAAYEELIDRYEQPIYSMVCRLTGNQEDACDVVQNVFLKVFRGVHSFREHSSLRTWIYRIAVNEAHNRRRWFARHCRKEISIESEGPPQANPIECAKDPGRSPYQQVLDRENRGLVEQALRRINPVFSAAVILRDVENLSYEEIAAILQVSLGTVKSRIQRGREALRHELTQQPDSGLAEVMAYQ
ncbi:MAG: sigma-70 family RNA polymerase sigma factor [Acidobacteriaceae bacterium]|nr:sigma-70 family RNA polymerase sigma factor [Acidobacteriaceae bacterium]MBV9296532.1 sigma-70 family RNA polymerase sigma factor [Acidobacteriaceae bacterium]MBV9765550.1 sigma-70 family RNA polymerase sigma factor [Acidobacteriaceae bacterium]